VGLVGAVDFLNAGGHGNGQFFGHHLGNIVDGPARGQPEKAGGVAHDVLQFHVLVHDDGQRDVIGAECVDETLQGVLLFRNAVQLSCAQHAPGKFGLAAKRRQRTAVSLNQCAGFSPTTVKLVLVVNDFKQIAHFTHGFTQSQHQQATGPQGKVDCTITRPAYSFIARIPRMPSLPVPERITPAALSPWSSARELKKNVDRQIDAAGVILFA